MDNPNALDLDDPQVMSRPNDSYAHSRSGQPSGQVVNGVDRPLRGRLDLDDEVTTNRSDLELEAAATDRLPPDVQQRLGEQCLQSRRVTSCRDRVSSRRRWDRELRLRESNRLLERKVLECSRVSEEHFRPSLRQLKK